MEKRKKSSSSGITLIALVISIIVMLILAGISINAIVGENGVLTKAQKATIENKKASILEAIDLELASYNIDTILNNPEETSSMLEGLKNKNVIDTVLSSGGQTTDTSKALAIPQFDDSNNYTGYIDYGVMKDDYSILLSVDGSGIYKASFGEINVSSGGSVEAGTTVVTGDAFNSGSGTENAEDKGKFTIDNDASVMFVDEIEGELSIYVKSGTHAKVNIFKDMTLTNAGVKRSAIDIEAGGILDLYVADGATVTVNSGLGEDASGATPGKGGYAGIHVPEGATLNLKGTGVVKAIAGNASSGSLTNTQVGGAGGGGAGAGIGGNGGNGGAGKNGKGNSGENGEDCGVVNIYNNLTVYAYGGAGGNGSRGVHASSNAGGGGGYPGAGIGGGGAGAAGGTCCAGAGGYSGGAANADERDFGKNGLAGAGGTDDVTPPVYDRHSGGGGYFQGGDGIDKNNIDRASVGLGGMYSQGWNSSLDHVSGSGGTAGKGGSIKVSSNSKVYAFNGNLYTDGTAYNDGINQCPIYIQEGIVLEKYEYGTGTNSVSFIINKVSEQGTSQRSGYVNTMYESNATFTANKTLNINTKLGITTNDLLKNVDMSKQGVGSGAGYIEVSNGTYAVDSSLN